MSEQLPITIRSAEDLIFQLPGLTPAINELEAQFNFQTMTAGWYGDEDKILQIHLSLVSSVEFVDLHQQKQPGKRFDFADDVLSYHNRELQQILCVVALTHKELALFSQRRELLAVYLQAKIHKVLNLIAEQEKLFPI